MVIEETIKYKIKFEKEVSQSSQEVLKQNKTKQKTNKKHRFGAEIFAQRWRILIAFADNIGSGIIVAHNHP